MRSMGGPPGAGVRGFTLVELLTVIAISAILLALALPSFTPLVQRSRSGALASDLASDLAFARTEAIRRGQAVTVCRSADAGTSAWPSCSGVDAGGVPGNDWSVGWIVFVPAIGGNPALVPGQAQVLQRRAGQGAAGAGRRDIAVNQAAAGATQFVSFDRDGTMLAAPPGGLLFAVDFREPAAAPSRELRCVGVSAFGRVWTYPPNPRCF